MRFTKKIVYINLLTLILIIILYSNSLVFAANSQLKSEIKPSNFGNQKTPWSSSEPNITSITNSKKENKTNIPVKTISLSKNSMFLVKGNTQKLSVKFNPTNASSKAITWKSSNPKIVSVNKNGVVKGIENGTITITAKTKNKKEAKCQVTVINKVTTKLNGHKVTLPDLDDRVYFLDVVDEVNGDWVGSDAILISSNGKFALIDAGLKSKAPRVIKYLNDIGVKKLEFILITHAHEDHLSGLKTILKTGIKVDKLYIKDLSRGGSKYKSQVNDKIKFAKSLNIKVCDVTTGRYKTEKLGDFTFNFYNLKDRVKYSYTDENVNSIVTLAKIHGKKIYFAADIQNSYGEEIYAETEAARAVGKIDFYKVSHHSYNMNSPDDVLKILKPRYGVVTNHKNDRNTSETRESMFKYTSINDSRLWYTATGTVILSIKPNGDLNVKKLAEDK